MRTGYGLQVTGYSHLKLIIDNSLKIVNCKLKIAHDEATS